MTAQPSTDKLDLNAEFVRGLLRDQHPDLADLPIRFVSGGGDNALYRLGDDLVMRLPLRPWASGLLRNEQKWLPSLAERLPIAVPAGPDRASRARLSFSLDRIAVVRGNNRKFRASSQQSSRNSDRFPARPAHRRAGRCAGQ